MKSKLLKILTGVVAASAVGAPVTAFASPVKATEAENTNTETTDTAGDVKTTDKALEDTKKEAQQDTTKSDAASDETKNDTTNKDSNTSDEKTTKDSTSDNQTDAQNADSKKDTSDNKGNTSNASKLSKQKQGYINILNSYIQIDLNNLSQYSLSELQDRAQSNDLASISEDFIKDPNYASLYKQAVKVKKALNDYLNGLYNSSECVAFQNKLKTIDTSTPEGIQEALKAYSQLSPRLQEYVCDLPSMQAVFGKDSEIKVLFDDLKGESTPDWNDFFKKYNQLSAEKKAIVKNYDPDKIKSGARSLIDKAIDDANTSKQSDDLKNFLADFDEAAGHITSQNRAQIAKEYLSLSKADQNYVKTHLDGAVEYFGLDDAVAQAQKGGQKKSGTTQKSSTLRKKFMAISKKFKRPTVKVTSSKVNDATNAVSEILEMIEGIF
ncbi:MAG: hypothetical protein ACOX1H_02035 [Pseudoramibacter sp.]|jgi:hypothetical protein